MLSIEDKSYLQEMFTFWEQLNAEEQSLLLHNTIPVHYSKGQNIHSADQDCIGVLVIKSGELRIYTLSEEGKEITLYRLTGGEVCILSASCILESITFDVHIDAEQDSEVLLVSASAFLKLIRQNVHAENYLLRMSVERFSEVMWAMEQILFMSFDRRLAIFLLDETTKLGEDQLSLTQEQIARYMGSAREVVSRMLKYFSNEGIVELYRGGIRIIDRERLRNLV